MAIVLEQFERVAAAVTERTAELLSAQTSVIDERGIVVASSDPHALGSRVDSADSSEDSGYLRVPLRLDSRNGEVIVVDPGNGESVPPRLARVLVDLIINQTAIVDRLPNQYELKNKFIHDLLCGPARDEAAILREAEVLGMDLSPRRAVILIDASDYILAPYGANRVEPSDSRVRRRAQLVIASVVGFFDLPTDTICGYIGEGEVVVLKASTTKDLAAWSEQNDGRDQWSPSWANLVALKRAGDGLLARLRSDTRSCVSVGIGRYHPGIAGLARSYQDARAALTLGRRFHGHNHVHCLDRLGIAAFVGVADEGTKVDLATYLLSPLDHEPDLISTLDAFFVEDCCPSRTAGRLSIHRNTLSYRLDKVSLLTGLDPRRFDDAVQIRLALVLRSLQDAA